MPSSLRRSPASTSKSPNCRAAKSHPNNLTRWSPTDPASSHRGNPYPVHSNPKLGIYGTNRRSLKTSKYPLERCAVGEYCAPARNSSRSVQRSATVAPKSTLGSTPVRRAVSGARTSRLSYRLNLFASRVHQRLTLVVGKLINKTGIHGIFEKESFPCSGFPICFYRKHSVGLVEVQGERNDGQRVLVSSKRCASSEPSVGQRYALLGTGSSARAAQPDVGQNGFSFSCSSQLPFELACPRSSATETAFDRDPLTWYGPWYGDHQDHHYGSERSA